jgi:hypothetical protein
VTARYFLKFDIKMLASLDVEIMFIPFVMTMVDVTFKYWFAVVRNSFDPDDLVMSI